jgi:hypothetical protein
MHGAIERLARKGFLMDLSVGSPVEETADPRFELPDHAWRVIDQRPGELLVVEKAPAL